MSQSFSVCERPDLRSESRIPGNAARLVTERQMKKKKKKKVNEMVGEGGWAVGVFDDDTRCIKPIIKGERFLARFQLCCSGDSEEVSLPLC